MQAAEHVLRYLSRTHEKFNTLWGWVDAEFAADLDTRRSHTGQGSHVPARDHGAGAGACSCI